MTVVLDIKKLQVEVQEKPILKGVNLQVQKGQVHALMGPNGSGKSTLANTLLGHPKYTVTGGKILWHGKDITELSPTERAQSGLFLAFQYPQTIAGVTLGSFLHTALNALNGARKQKPLSVLEFRRLLQAKMKLLKVPETFTKRYLNDGFSGGEKKRAEILQLALLGPSLAVLDETDSGLDIDALKTVAEGINAVKRDRPDLSVLVITHYQRILDYVKPDYVHVMLDGRIAESGGPELVGKLEREGYDWLMPKTTTKTARR